MIHVANITCPHCYRLCEWWRDEDGQDIIARTAERSRELLEKQHGKRPGEGNFIKVTFREWCGDDTHRWILKRHQRERALEDLTGAVPALRLPSLRAIPTR